MHMYICTYVQTSMYVFMNGMLMYEYVHGDETLCGCGCGNKLVLKYRKAESRARAK